LKFLLFLLDGLRQQQGYLIPAHFQASHLTKCTFSAFCDKFYGLRQQQGYLIPAISRIFNFFDYEKNSFYIHCFFSNAPLWMQQ
jgi:hypothetical protein